MVVANRSTSSLWPTVVLATVVVIGLAGILFVSADNKNQGSAGGEDGSCDSDTNTAKYPHQVGSSLLYHFDAIVSTQDEARKIVMMQSTGNGDGDGESIQITEDIQTVIVTAAEQSQGRGTGGRVWLSTRGNTFVTICIRQSAWMHTTLPMTLLPIKVGQIMAEHIHQLIMSCFHNGMEDATQPPPMVNIKWPNDVLVDDNKISGVLIESANDWFLIGIGVNVAQAPEIPTSGPNHGRVSTSIRSHCQLTDVTTTEEFVVMARDLGQTMGFDLNEWLSRFPMQDAADVASERNRLVQEWRGWVDWDLTLTMRDETKEVVKPVDIEPDGRLRVRGWDGQDRLIVADYFF